MEAVLGFLGNLVGGVLQWMGVDRQARAAEEVARSQERQTRSLVDAAIATWAEWRRAQEAAASAARDATYWQQGTQRTRIYYNYQAARTGQAVLLLAAGAGLLGLALWRMSHE
jgi:hypothetical protein